MTPEGNEKTSARWTELAMRYLDGRLAPSEVEEFNAGLRDDPAAQAWLWDVAQQATTMGDLARQRTPSEMTWLPSLPVVGMFPNWVQGFLAFALLLATMVATAAVFWPRHNALATIVTVTQVTGDARWTSGGQVRSGVALGDKLAAGTLAVLDETGSLEVQFDDGTSLSLASNSEVVVSADPQKQIHVNEGELFFSVAPQPVGKPMVLHTATADIEVLGTEFAINAQREQTVLKVDRGCVRVRRLADGRTVDVAEKQAIVASLDAATPFRPSSPQSPPTDWQHDITEPVASTSRGEWLPASADDPARIHAVPCLAGRAQEGRAAINYGVVVRGLFGSNSTFVSLTNESVLHLRYRMKTPVAIIAFLCAKIPGGQFGANFEVTIPWQKDAAEPGEWRSADVPLSKCRLLRAGCAQAIDGTELGTLFINSTLFDAGLEISELAITQVSARN